MPRNTLKAFPTAMLRRGLAHFHPLCAGPGPTAPASDTDGGSVEELVPSGPPRDMPPATTPPDPNAVPTCPRESAIDSSAETIETSR